MSIIRNALRNKTSNSATERRCPLFYGWGTCQGGKCTLAGHSYFDHNLFHLLGQPQTSVIIWVNGVYLLYINLHLHLYYFKGGKICWVIHYCYQIWPASYPIHRGLPCPIAALPNVMACTNPPRHHLPFLIQELLPPLVIGMGKWLGIEKMAKQSETKHFLFRLVQSVAHCST